MPPEDVREAGSVFALLSDYAKNKAEAMAARISGQVQAALMLEGFCERLYATLPHGELADSRTGVTTMLVIDTRKCGNGSFLETTVRLGCDIVAVLVHPAVRGGPWFLHRAGSPSCRGERFRTKKAALESFGEMVTPVS